jgi:hypothetical protein
MSAMKDNNAALEKFHEEFIDFQKNMEKLNLLKKVAEDLKSYRKMIHLKRYD